MAPCPHTPGGNRTPNRRFWRPVLYQLSYRRTDFFFNPDGQGGSRTPDTAIFSRMLYQLSYLAPNKKPPGFGGGVWGYSGGGIRTRDLRVMSPTSYQAAPPRDTEPPI